MTPLIVSADDYAQNEAIDSGIIALILRNRLSAASCLTMSPRWPAAAQRLDATVRHHADIGIHLDFTQYGTLRYRHPELVLRCLLRMLPTAEIRGSIEQQLDRFENALGTPPDYVDGHQHVHQLPQIRDVLVTILQRRYGKKLPWIRIAHPPLADGVKARVIGLLGAGRLAALCRDSGIRHSRLLLGVYGFDGDTSGYEARLERWVTASAVMGAAPALMCHPALATADSAMDKTDVDPIQAARRREYAVLASDRFGQLLEEHRIQLVRGGILSL